MQFSILSITTYQGVSRWVRPNAIEKHMRLPCFTTHQNWLICVLPAKNNIYRYFKFLFVIIRLGSTLQNAILLIFVWRFVLNPLRARIHTPSCVSMPLKWSGTEITSKNAKISTLDPHNFFLAGYCYTILYETYLIPIHSIYWNFAPILRSQKKADFLWTRSKLILPACRSRSDKCHWSMKALPRPLCWSARSK